MCETCPTTSNTRSTLGADTCGGEGRIASQLGGQGGGGRGAGCMHACRHAGVCCGGTCMRAGMQACAAGTAAVAASARTCAEAAHVELLPHDVGPQQLLQRQTPDIFHTNPKPLNPQQDNQIMLSKMRSEAAGGHGVHTFSPHTHTPHTLQEYNQFMLSKMRSEAAGGQLTAAREAAFRSGGLNVALRELLGSYTVLE
eukprot:189087-Chlamydomonas_euryale.AAC.1